MLFLPIDFTNPYMILLVSLCLLAFGSFIGCLYYRIPQQLFAEWQQEVSEWSACPSPPSVFVPKQTKIWRSRCTHCQKTLRWYHLIPVLSYIRQQGKCSFCGKRIDPMYCRLEVSVCFLGLYWLYTTHNWFEFIVLTATSSLLLLLAAIDQRHWILPDVLTQLLLWSGLTYHALLKPSDVPSIVLLVSSVYAFLLLFTKTYQIIRNLQGLGRGDIKLLAALAAWMPVDHWVAILGLASALAVIIQGVRFLQKRRSRLASPTPFAFGPYIVAAALTVQILL